MIEKLFLSEYNDIFNLYSILDSEPNELEVNRINIFVGANNSGKSRFLRELFLRTREREINLQWNGHIDFFARNCEDYKKN